MLRLDRRTDKYRHVSGLSSLSLHLYLSVFISVFLDPLSACLGLSLSFCLSVCLRSLPPIALSVSLRGSLPVFRSVSLFAPFPVSLSVFLWLFIIFFFLLVVVHACMCLGLLHAQDRLLRSLSYRGLSVYRYLLQLSSDISILLSFSEQYFLISKIREIATLESEERLKSRAPVIPHGAEPPKSIAPSSSASPLLECKTKEGVGRDSETGLNQNRDIYADLCQFNKKNRKVRLGFLNAKRKRYERQLKRQRLVFAFRELRQVQLLLDSVRNSVSFAEVDRGQGGGCWK